MGKPLLPDYKAARGGRGPLRWPDVAVSVSALCNSCIRSAARGWHAGRQKAPRSLMTSVSHQTEPGPTSIMNILHVNVART